MGYYGIDVVEDLKKEKKLYFTNKLAEEIYSDRTNIPTSAAATSDPTYTIDAADAAATADPTNPFKAVYTVMEETL